MCEGDSVPDRREQTTTEERLERMEVIVTALAVVALKGRMSRLNPRERTSAVRGAKGALTEFVRGTQ